LSYDDIVADYFLCIILYNKFTRPYNNPINQNVSNRLNTIYLNHIRKEDQLNDNYYQPDNLDITGQYEHIATLAENPDTVGGNAHEMTTLHDLGYEKTKDEAIKPRRSKKKPVEEGQGLSAGSMTTGGLPVESAPAMEASGVSGGAMAGCGVSGGGVSGGGMSGGDLGDVVKTVGHIAVAVAPYAPLLLGLGKGKTRAEIVKEVMKDKNLSLIEASKYVKEHGLYKASPSDKPKAKRKPRAKAKLEPKTEPPADETKPTPTIQGGAKKTKGESERSKIVKQVMEEKGMKLIEASKYVKEHNLYKPKEK
jgi:hypothetical protein